jgi:hypothetical protein
MKNTRYSSFLPFLLASLTLASNTMAQTIEAQRTEAETQNDAPNFDSIAAARSRYIQNSDVSPDASNPLLAQLRRGGPGRPLPQRGYPRGTYQTPWTDHGNAGHILVGAAIGFGVGAALGASQSARNGTPVGGGILIGGALFGFLGGCAGKAVGDLQGLHFASVRRRRTYRPSGPEDDEVSELRSDSKVKENRPEAPARLAAPGQPAGVEATAATSPIRTTP